MEILGNLVHPLKSILVTGELPDSVGDQDDKLPAHQPGLSVPCTQMGEKDTEKDPRVTWRSGANGRAFCAEAAAVRSAAARRQCTALVREARRGNLLPPAPDSAEGQTSL